MNKILFAIIISIQITINFAIAEIRSHNGKNSAPEKNNIVRSVLKHGIAEYIPTGVYSWYDLQTYGSPQTIWQDPANPANVHMVYNAARYPASDSSRSVYLFSSNFGQTWSLVTDISNAYSAWPSISGFSDGRPVIVATSNSNGTPFRTKILYDSLPGMGNFIELDPIETSKSWPRLIAAENDKVVFIASSNSSAAYTNTVLNQNPPGTFSGYVYYSGEHGSNYYLDASAGGKIGHIYYGAPNTSFILKYRYSTDWGITWEDPVNFWSPPAYYMFSRGSMSLIFANETPVAAFTICRLQSGLSPDLTKPSTLLVWNPVMNGGVPVVAADSTIVPFFKEKSTLFDYYKHLCYPSIGKSSDGRVLVMTFHTPSGIYAETPDSSSYYDIWIAISTNNGATWINHEKITPDTPRRDWRFAGISPTNHVSGNMLTVQISCQSDSVPGIHATGFLPPVGKSELIGIRYTTDISVAVLPESGNNVSGFVLSQNYPNPFNPKTVISYSLSMNSLVTLKVYDMLGKEVATLVNEKLSPGNHKVEFDGSNFPSGVYYYKLQAGDFTDERKMILLK